MPLPRAMSRILLACALMASPLVFAGSKPEAPAASAESATVGDGYVIKPGDQIKYQVVEDRDAPSILFVASSGEVSVPYLGRLSIGGKTFPEASRVIGQALEKNLLNKATVKLSLESSAADRKVPRISVSGEVKSAGSQDLPVGERYTVKDAILKAGFTHASDQRKVHVYRQNAQGKKETFIVDVKAILTEGMREKDLELMAEDSIHVPTLVIRIF